MWSSVVPASVNLGGREWESVDSSLRILLYSRNQSTGDLVSSTHQFRVVQQLLFYPFGGFGDNTGVHARGGRFLELKFRPEIRSHDLIGEDWSGLRGSGD
ncbi:unnamed protein product [Calypogeia fissa]